MRIPETSSWVTWIAIWSYLSIGRCLAAEQHCDISLRRDLDYPLGYQQRGDRCEGLYIREVSDQILQVASFTASFDELDPKTIKTVALNWGGDRLTPIHLRAVDLREKLYYRMDTLRPAGAASYQWPMDILAALRLRKQDLGVLAWISQKIQGEIRSIYLPVSVGRQDLGQSRYELILLPSRPLKSVFLTIAPLRANGSTGTPLVNGHTVRSGYWPAGEPLRIALPPLSQTGLHYLEIGAPLATGGSAAMEMWFHHDGGVRN